MVKLICFLKRKPGMSADEFHTHWRERHGPLVASTKSGQHAIRYEQNHRASAAQDHLGAAGFDGVTIQWFESVADFEASLREDDYADIAADIDRFLDTDGLVWMLTEDAEVVWDSRAR
jgi:uncharacterized protein (TIGR02118 family)